MGGRYLHALGNCDKGKATSDFKKLVFHSLTGSLVSALEIALTTYPCYKNVDKPFYVNETLDKKTVWKEIKSIAQLNSTPTK